MTEDEFDKLLLSALDEGLFTLGDSSRQAVMFYVETVFHLKEEKIPANLTEFKKALELIFGPGAAYLEKIMVQKLQRKLGIPVDENDALDLLKCAEIAKARIVQAGEVTTK